MQTDPAEIELPRDRSCGVRARRWIERQAGPEIARETLDDLKLVATELVDNAYLHGRGRIVLKLLRTTDAFRVEVIDEGEDAVIEISRAPAQTGGRGLRLVDALAASWGAYEGTTHVWAEVPDASGG